VTDLGIDRLPGCKAMIDIGAKLMVVIAVSTGAEVFSVVEAVAHLIAVTLIQKGSLHKRRCGQDKRGLFRTLGAVDVVVVTQL